MQHSSPSVGALGGSARQGPGRDRQPGKIPDRDHRLAVPARREPDVSLCAVVLRARSCSQVPGPARDRNRSGHRHRPRQRPDQAHHHARARLRRMGVLGLAGLPGQRDGRTASARCCPHLCPPLCPVHAGRDCRRGRSRCARPCGGGWPFRLTKWAFEAQPRCWRIGQSPAFASCRPTAAGLGKASPLGKARATTSCRLTPRITFGGSWSLSLSSSKTPRLLPAGRTGLSRSKTSSQRRMPRRSRTPSLPG